MYLDYSKLKSGQTKQPVLRLKTLAGKELGVIPWVYNLTFELNYSDVSSVEFDVPRHSNGKLNPMYRLLTSYKMLYTEQFGIYILQRPTTSGDGVSEVKHITGYSLEQLFEKKILFLEEGTYNFWNPVQPEDTILGRVVELDTTWSVGYVDPKLIGCYRTFDEYDSDVLSFCYGSAMEKYNCAIVFDVYTKTINAYDASKSRGTVPIYLSYQNLVDAVDLEELTDDMVTKLHLYGSDDLSIREVNPTGTDYIVDLSYFISNGDFDIVADGSSATLAERIKSWDAEIRSSQTHYTNLVAARASRTAQKLAEEVELSELKSELEVLTAQQSVTIQAIALEKTSAGKESQQQQLDEINRQIDEKNEEIAAQENVISDLQSEIDQYAEDIEAVVDRLSISKYFTAAEQKILNLYLIEGEVVEETFVATDVDTSASGTSSTLQGGVSITGADIARATLNGKTLYAVAGGSLKLNNPTLTADIVRGTLEVNPNTNEYILTAYLGSTTFESHDFPSGLITASGTLSQFSSDVTAVTQDEVTEYKGTQASFNAGTSKLFFTVNVSEYQKYSVAQELYAFGEELLEEWAWPVYEFSIDTANFLFQKEFEPFKDALEFGKSIYLNIGDDGVIEPKLIGLSLDFENPENLTLTFSNRFQKKDVVASWLSDINKTSTSSRSFDASKYIYNKTANKTTQVSQFMENALDAAVNTIIGASNQSVVINGAGIHIGGDGNYQLRLVDNMIAMTNDNWKTSKLAIGRFYSDANTGLKDDNGNPITIGEVWGINTELLAGNLIIGNNMVLENANDEGVMQFKIDATGAWLYNASYVMQHDDGGLMIFDPRYGIVAGSKLLFDTNGTTVTPEFLDEYGDIQFDSDGMPKNANFFLDARDGSAYFRGKVSAIAGQIGGFTIEETFLHGGSGSNYVALNGSGSGTNSLYAIWAGNSNPTNAPFSVKKNGDIIVRNGEFSGTVSGASFKDRYGNSMMNSAYEFTADYLNLNGLNVGNGNFVVDSSGNVSIRGSITMAAGSSINWAYVQEVNPSQNSAYSLANSAIDYAADAYDRADDAYNNADNAYSLAWENRLTDKNVFDVLTGGGSRFGIFSDSSSNHLYINANYIRAGTIDADIITLGSSYGGFCCGEGSDGVSSTWGSLMYGSAGPYANYYMFVSNKGAMMRGGSASIYCAGNGIHASEEISVDSDIRLKNDIRTDVERYEKFFLGLQASTFCLKNHDDGSRHIGFIAQDVDQTRISCGLDKRDLALLEFCEKDIKSTSGNVSEKYYSIRYGELIPLCVHMIQKLYQRIDHLEKKLVKE